MENGTNDKKNKIAERITEKAEMYGITKKAAFSVLSVFSTIIVLFALAFTQAGFDITKFSTVEYWTGFAMLFGISIWGMVNGKQIGDDMSRNNQKGAFRVVMNKYGNICKTLDDSRDFAYFEDWLFIYRQKKLRKKIEGILSDNNINQYAVLDLDLTDLDMLKAPFKKDWKGTEHEGKYKDDVTYFRTYSEEQIAVIKYCIEGKIKVADLPSSFFKSIYQQNGRDMWEMSAKAMEKKRLLVGVSFGFQGLLMLSSSFLLKGLVPGWKDGFNVTEALLDFASQLFNLFMGVVLGIYLGYNIVKIDLTYLEFKVSVLKQYKDEIEAKIFVPKSEEEKAKEAYEQANNGEVANGREENDQSGTMD